MPPIVYTLPRGRTRCNRSSTSHQLRATSGQRPTLRLSGCCKALTSLCTLYGGCECAIVPSRRRRWSRSIYGEHTGWSSDSDTHIPQSPRCIGWRKSATASSFAASRASWFTFSSMSYSQPTRPPLRSVAWHVLQPRAHHPACSRLRSSLASASTASRILFSFTSAINETSRRHNLKGEGYLSCSPTTLSYGTAIALTGHLCGMWAPRWP